MELRGQDKEIGLPSSAVHQHPSSRDSSSKVPSASTVPASGERRREQHHSATTQTTLEGHPPYQHHHHNQTHKPTRDPDITPDPAPSAIAATSATNTAPAAPGRSISRSPPPPASKTSSVRYRECLRNHAASTGAHVVDGCGEFMPSGEEGTPKAWKCAACECHRNFHRKEIDGEFQYITNSYYKNSTHRAALPPPQQLATSLTHLQSSLHQHHRHPHGLSMPGSAAPIAPIMLAFGGGAGGAGAAAESSSEDLNMFQSNLQGQESGNPSSVKKRFRTKFSQEQKEKMTEFAEKLEWKIQKQDEQEVQEFCSQVDVKRKVFKVWMHNNKQAMKKKQM